MFVQAMAIQTTRQQKWLQLLWWVGLYIFWVMVFQKREFAFSRTATIEFCYLIFIAANFYFNVFYTIPHFLYTKKYFSFAGLMLAGIIVAALLRVPLATYLNQHHFLIGKPQPGPADLFVRSLLNIFIWVVCLVAGKIAIDRFRFQQYLDEMAKEKEQAELDFLNAQFNPHFLFNSINSIYGHIDKHNTVARNMLLTFSDMLRYQLYDCNSATIGIEKEMNYIKNYVALQTARKDESLIVELSIDDNVKGFSIAPLLFIAFIENSFKYVGNSEDSENKVSINLCRKEDTLHFKCYNTKDPDFISPIEHKGIGMANAKRRLALLYPQQHELDILDEKDSYEVNLKILLA
ncbi:sensor histidine kinase [Parasediminibacterium sp. JCM 36343]|uniref:sensor histidine kinase n=1 Tax=Parasediminibacterium sp. JCM 36343 TaxID=3374279 RepID=UPI00397E9076